MNLVICITLYYLKQFFILELFWISPSFFINLIICFVHNNLLFRIIRDIPLDPLKSVTERTGEYFDQKVEACVVMCPHSRTVIIKDSFYINLFY